ncbi:glycosyltransferase family 9 protein [Pseudoflavitalea sp. X16]|nr:glycosyltransferase family 9 protein [Paraflavitalea devenefica]
MKIDTMRIIDIRAGIPLCFIISPFVWITDLLRRPRRGKPDIRRVLFIELSEMGSAVIVDPAMRKLQQEGEAELYFVIFKNNVKSLNILNTIPAGNIFTMDPGNFYTLLKDIIRFIAWCRAKKITTVIDLELFSRFTALLSFFSGALHRIGFASYHDEGLYRANLINRPVRYNAHVHIAVNFVSLVNKALDRYSTPYATPPVSKDELKLTQAAVESKALTAVQEKIRNLYPAWNGEAIVLLNANASDLLPQRRWPQENFAAAARELLASFHNVLIIATGAAAEKEYVQQVVNKVGHEKCVNSAGIFLFEELVPLYTLSTCMLTNDSGPAHFASVTPLKIFVLFGPETPALYGPLGNAEPFYLGLPCSPCVSAANHRKTSCTDRPCITGIQPAWVSARLRQYLTEKGASVRQYPDQVLFPQFPGSRIFINE